MTFTHPLVLVGAVVAVGGLLAVLRVLSRRRAGDALTYSNLDFLESATTSRVPWSALLVGAWALAALCLGVSLAGPHLVAAVRTAARSTRQWPVGGRPNPAAGRRLLPGVRRRSGFWPGSRKGRRRVADSHAPAVYRRFAPPLVPPSAMLPDATAVSRGRRSDVSSPFSASPPSRYSDARCRRTGVLSGSRATASARTARSAGSGIMPLL